MSNLNKGVHKKASKSLKSRDFVSQEAKLPFDFNLNYKILQNRKKSAVKNFMDKTMQSPRNIQKLMI